MMSGKLKYFIGGVSMYGNCKDFREFLDKREKLAYYKVECDKLSDGRKGHRVTYVPKPKEQIAKDLGMELEDYEKAFRAAQIERRNEMKKTVAAMNEAGKTDHEIAIAMGYPETLIQALQKNDK